MTVDLTPLVNVLLPLAAAAVSAAIPILVPAVLKRLRIANSADLASRIEAAANAGAGMAYSYAVAHEGGLAHVAVQDAAIGVAVNHVSQSVPDALTTLGVTPEHVQQMVKARLGALLAADPTVTAGTPATVTTPTPAAEPPANPAPQGATP